MVPSFYTCYLCKTIRCDYRAATTLVLQRHCRNIFNACSDQLTTWHVLARTHKAVMHRYSRNESQHAYSGFIFTLLLLADSVMSKPMCFTGGWMDLILCLV